MKKIILLFVFYLMVFLPQSVACSCFEISTFCEAIADGNISNGIVIRGTISEEKNDGVDVQVNNLLLGELEDEEIFIRSGNGADCGVFTGNFSKGESYIFTLYEGWMDDAYWLSICQVSYLKIENEIIKGAIAPGIESLPFEELATLENCGSGLNIFSVKYSLAVFPNPTIDFISIKNISNGDSPFVVQAEFIDVIGRKVRQYQKTDGWLAEEEWMIDVKELAGGVYFLKIISGPQDVIFKIVKQ